MLWDARPAGRADQEQQAQRRDGLPRQQRRRRPRRARDHPGAAAGGPRGAPAECGWAEQFSPRRRDRAQFDQVLDVWTMAMQAAIGQEHVPVPTPGDRRPHGRPSPDAGTTGSGTPDPRTAGRPLQLSPELAGYLRASLCIPSWRDAVLVMAAAGRSAAERGAEDFGMFDTEAGSAALPGTMSASRLGPTPSPLPGPMSGRTSVPGPLPRIPAAGRRPPAAAPPPAPCRLPKRSPVTGKSCSDWRHQSRTGP